MTCPSVPSPPNLSGTKTVQRTRVCLCTGTPSFKWATGIHQPPFPGGLNFTICPPPLATPSTEGYGSSRIHLHFYPRAVTRAQGRKATKPQDAWPVPGNGWAQTWRASASTVPTDTINKSTGIAQPRLHGGVFFADHCFITRRLSQRIKAPRTGIFSYNSSAASQ